MLCPVRVSGQLANVPGTLPCVSPGSLIWLVTFLHIVPRVPEGNLPRCIRHDDLIEGVPSSRPPSWRNTGRWIHWDRTTVQTGSLHSNESHATPNHPTTRAKCLSHPRTRVVFGGPAAPALSACQGTPWMVSPPITRQSAATAHHKWHRAPPPHTCNTPLPWRYSSPDPTAVCILAGPSPPRSPAADAAASSPWPRSARGRGGSCAVRCAALAGRGREDTYARAGGAGCPLR